ncbi:hypothetical protein Gohar_027217, partial [Gossypium harknessii]|nr:hypothetical protein [Gossypium harknessii]
FHINHNFCIKQQGAGVNQKSTVAIETLRPKLQRTPHQQLPPRRPTCTSGRDNMVRAVDLMNWCENLMKVMKMGRFIYIYVNYLSFSVCLLRR